MNTTHSRTTQFFALLASSGGTILALYPEYNLGATICDLAAICAELGVYFLQRELHMEPRGRCMRAQGVVWLVVKVGGAVLGSFGVVLGYLFEDSPFVKGLSATLEVIYIIVKILPCFGPEVAHPYPPPVHVVAAALELNAAVLKLGEQMAAQVSERVVLKFMGVASKLVAILATFIHLFLEILGVV